METYYQVTKSGVQPIQVDPAELKKSSSWMIAHEFNGMLIFENYSRAMLCWYEKKSEYDKINLLTEVNDLMGKWYESDNKMEYGFGFWVKERITGIDKISDYPSKENPDQIWIYIDVMGTDGKIHQYATEIWKERLKYIWTHRLYN